MTVVQTGTGRGLSVGEHESSLVSTTQSLYAAPSHLPAGQPLHRRFEALQDAQTDAATVR
jgi:hypothetical protein